MAFVERAGRIPLLLKVGKDQSRLQEDDNGSTAAQSSGRGWIQEDTVKECQSTTG